MGALFGGSSLRRSPSGGSDGAVTLGKAETWPGDSGRRRHHSNPPIDELLDVVDSKYRLVIMAAKRGPARINSYYSQLGEGPPRARSGRWSRPRSPGEAAVHLAARDQRPAAVPSRPIEGLTAPAGPSRQEQLEAEESPCPAPRSFFGVGGGAFSAYKGVRIAAAADRVRTPGKGGPDTRCACASSGGGRRGRVFPANRSAPDVWTGIAEAPHVRLGKGKADSGAGGARDR